MFCNASVRRSSVTSLAVLIALTITACGKKGDPLPPIQIIPVATSDLELRQLGTVLELRFSYPKSTTAGEPIPGLDAVEIWSMSREIDPAAELPEVMAPEFAASGQHLLTLAGAELTSATSGDRIVTRFPFQVSETPSMIVYGTRTRAQGGEWSAISNLATMRPVFPPAPPVDLALEPTAEGVTVSWVATGEELEGFHLYRRLATSRSYGEPIRFADGDHQRMLDETARFGDRYIYAVTGVVSREPRIETSRSEEIEIRFDDTFAPPPPASVEALPQQGSIRLVWRPSPADDVAGYLVYRRIEDGEMVKMTPEPTSELTWVDTGLATGVTFEYTVTAVDRSGNEGVPSSPIEAQPR